jgi:hypothetical protein
MVCRTVAMLHYRPSVFQKHLIEARWLRGRPLQYGSVAEGNDEK